MSEAIDEWLSDRIEEGLGAIEFCMTDQGYIGLFRNDSEKAWAIGDTALDAAKEAARKFPQGQPLTKRMAATPTPQLEERVSAFLESLHGEYNEVAEISAFVREELAAHEFRKNR